MNKFIVTSGGQMRFGDVAMHRDLLRRGDTCIGGGVYEFDLVEGRMLLSGRSYDYGRVRWSSIDELYVPESLRGLDLMYEDLSLSDFIDVKYV